MLVSEFGCGFEREYFRVRKLPATVTHQLESSRHQEQYRQWLSAFRRPGEENEDIRRLKPLELSNK